MKVTKAKTLSTLLYRFGYFLPRLVASEQTRTTAHLFRGTPPLGLLRIVSMTLRAAGRPGADAKRGVDGDVCEANDRIALGPRGWRRGAQGFGAARVSAPRNLTSRRLSERSGRRPRSEFGAGPKARAPQSSRPKADRHRRVAFSLVTFFWRSKRKLLPCRGHIPTRPHASEHGNDKAGSNTSV